MNDEEALDVLRQTLENAKKVTERHPHAFYGLYISLGDDLFRISQHFKNDKLRLWIVYLRVTGGILKAYLDHIFQDLVVEELKASFEGEEDIRKEIILNVASRFLSVSVLSDENGRDVLNMGELSQEFAEELAGLDEPTKIVTTLKVSNAIREIFKKESFINARKDEMVEFYARLIESSKNGWRELYDTFNEYLLKWDKVAIIWNRT